MKNSIKVLATSSVTGIVMAGLIAAPAFACTPKGVITKYVTDVTTGSQMVDANTVATALTVHPGDTLTYTIVVGNNGGTTKNSLDAMIQTQLTDTLPAGVAPVSGSATISENLGTVAEHSKVTKTYNVTVSKDAKDGDVITNKACFTGEATNHDSKQHQSGCDVAIVKVSVPPTPTPTPAPTPQPQPQILAAATTLPNTGAGSFLLPAGIVGGLGYAGNMLLLKRRGGRKS